MQLTRRVGLAGSGVALALVVSRLAWAQDASTDTSFIQEFGTKLVAVVNGEGSLPDKEKRLRPLIDSSVDVDTIGRFCLGRYASAATQDQLADFLRLFHDVLLYNITSKIGEYRGVSFRMGDATIRGSEALIATVVQKPNAAPTNVRWVVSMTSGKPKIVDVVAEGTSLRLTQRSDYSSFLNHNGNSIDSLLSAMRHQIAANS